MGIKELEKEFQSKLADLRLKNASLGEKEALQQEAKLKDQYQSLFLSAEFEADPYRGISIFEMICIASGLRSPHNVQIRV